MTQALQNNLSTIQDLFEYTTNPKDDVKASDFQEVLDTQTSTEITTATQNDNENEHLIKQEEKKEDVTSILETLKEFCLSINKPDDKEIETIDNDIIAEQEQEEEAESNNDNQKLTISSANNNQENILNNILVHFSHTHLSDKEKLHTEFQKSNTNKTDSTSVLFSETDLESLTEEIALCKEICTEENIDTNSSNKTLEDIIDEEKLQELKVELFESDTASDSSSDLMQNQSPQEQGIKAMIQNNLPEFNEIKMNETQPTAKNAVPQETNPSKIIEQVSKHLEGMKSGSRVNMVLNPESLGKVEIHLLNTKEGLSAQFTVATQDAKNILMKGLEGLKETLAAHGVSVDNVSVKLNESQESKYNPDWTEQENSNKEHRERHSEREKRHKDEFEKTMSFIEEENGKV